MDKLAREVAAEVGMSLRYVQDKANRYGAPRDERGRFIFSPSLIERIKKEAHDARTMRAREEPNARTGAHDARTNAHELERGSHYLEDSVCEVMSYSEHEAFKTRLIEANELERRLEEVLNDKRRLEASNERLMSILENSIKGIERSQALLWKEVERKAIRLK
jgi:hypothetical protein